MVLFGHFLTGRISKLTDSRELPCKKKSTPVAREYWIIYRGPSFLAGRMIRPLAHPLPPGTVTFFIQTFFIRNKVYTNFLYTGQILYGTKFIQDKFYTGTKFIEDKVYTGTKFIRDKVYTVTKFIRGQSLYKLFSYCTWIKGYKVNVKNMYISYNQIIYEYM